MKTKMSDQQGTGVEESATPWYEKMAEVDSSKARGWGKTAGVAAVVVVVGLIAWQFLRGSQQSEVDSRTDLLGRGELLLPDDAMYLNRNIGSFSLGPTGSGYYTDRNRDQRRFRSGPLLMSKESAEYVESVENVLDEMDDKQGDFADSPQEWRFWNIKQQLHWYAAMNLLDNARKKSHLESQLGALDVLDDKFAKNTVLSLHPRPTEADEPTLEIWRAMATDELAFFDKNAIPADIAADEGLQAVLELENGKMLEIEFFSKAAPVTVANFVRLAKEGFYDGTCFHQVDATNGTLAGGGELSKMLADKTDEKEQRRRIWHMSDPGYKLPREVNPLLELGRGSIVTQSEGLSFHGSHFIIHLNDPEEETVNYSQPVFARITSGLEALDELLKTETIDDANAENSLLPKVPLRVKKVTITGDVEHAGHDSWKPTRFTQELPEPTEEEKRLEQEAAAKKTEEEAKKKAEEEAKKGEEKPKDEGEKK